MAKKKNLFVRIIFILLFVVLLPLLLVEKLFKGIFYLIKKRIFLKKEFGAEEFLENAYIEKIDIMEGYEFEKFLKILFFFKGYQVKETARTGDYGADLILTKKGVVTVVQAKRYNANVGAKALQEIYSAKAHYHADEMMVVTNAGFTKQAYIMAKEQAIELVGREELLSLIEEVKEIILQSNVIKKSKESDLYASDGDYKYRI